MRRRWGIFGVLGAAGASAVTAIMLATSGGTTVFYVATAGSDANPGTKAQPFLTFDKAYRSASKGVTVQVAGGVYRPQTIDYDATKTAAGGGCNTTDTSGCVTFRPEPGATVQIGGYTQTSADIDMATETTIPVISTSGFNVADGVRVGRSTYTCTGSTASSFTGCTPNVTCGATSGQECGWAAGTDVVSLTGLKLTGARYLRFEDVTAKSVSTDNDAGDVHNAQQIVLDNVAGGLANIGGGGATGGTDTFSWINSDLSFNGSFPVQVGPASHVTFSNDTVHGYYDHLCIATATQPDPNKFCHGDGLFISSTTDFTVERSIFYDNEPFDIFNSYNSTGNPGPYVLRNNFFGPLVGGTDNLAIRPGDNTESDYTIEANSFWNGISMSPQSTATNAQYVRWIIRGNIVNGGFTCTQPSGATTFDVTFSYNLNTGTACAGIGNLGGQSRTDFWASSPSAGDLHLISGATSAEGAGDPANCPTVDVDGQMRSSLTPCDAGADER